MRGDSIEERAIFIAKYIVKIYNKSMKNDEK